MRIVTMHCGGNTISTHVRDQFGFADNLPALLGEVEKVRPGFILAVITHFDNYHKEATGDSQLTCDHVAAFFRGELILEPLLDKQTPEGDPWYCLESGQSP